MKYLVKVRVNTETIKEFGEALVHNTLDRSCIKGETYCLHEDPAVGFSIWEVSGKDEFDVKFENWKKFYSEVEVKEVISPNEAMVRLVSGKH